MIVGCKKENWVKAIAENLLLSPMGLSSDHGYKYLGTKANQCSEGLKPKIYDFVFDNLFQDIYNNSLEMWQLNNINANTKK